MLSAFLQDERLSKVRVLQEPNKVWHFRDGLLKPLCRREGSFEEVQLKNVQSQHQCHDCRDITERMYQGW